MKRSNTIIVLSSLLILAMVATVWAWGKSATGQITDLKVDESMATVQGITSNGSLWLGYTVYWADGKEKDCTPVKVKGKFDKTLSYQPRPQGIKKVTVCLWQKKVSKSDCAKQHNGTPCEYCEKNGYHMEGRVDCRSSR